MRFVFLVGSYYPYFSAIGKCILNIVKEIENEHEIIVVSNMDIAKYPTEEHYGSHRIIRVRTSSMQKRDGIIDKLAKSNSILRKYYQFKLVAERILGAGKIVTSKNSLQEDLICEYVDAMTRIRNIDVIIPTCYPFESVVAAQRYKTKYASKAKIIPFLFDKFSDSPTLHRNNFNKKIKYKRHLRLEEEMIMNSHNVFYVDSWINHMSKVFAKYNNKLIHIEHPLLINYSNGNDTVNINNNYKSVNLIYTGVLDRMVRPPDLVLQALSKAVDVDNKIKVNFYILGNCVKTVESYTKQHPSNIFNHGHVDSEEALKYINKSDILLSIGNTDVSLIPSKIFEYMSCGKPIIHFYTSEDDRVIDMLKKYELALCLKQMKNPNEEYVNEMISFVRKNVGVNISFNDVRGKFFEATPKFIAKKLTDSVNP
ncbi:glycosyltransferase [Bacillus alkalicellulosilyticus]|uniref:glycosyltransferase n=1 Tax=Alkalihalobacterium alkalicellulosilyticum TaxID=1912214 RepID=UPI000996B070|nr:glycosyltransferase [Bacillus alkalicellulosilyticus]